MQFSHTYFLPWNIKAIDGIALSADRRLRISQKKNRSDVQDAWN
jgi:hypothetical protein